MMVPGIKPERAWSGRSRNPVFPFNTQTKGAGICVARIVELWVLACQTASKGGAIAPVEQLETWGSGVPDGLNDLNQEVACGFGLHWPGKDAARALALGDGAIALTPPLLTATVEHRFIEGDNLAVLKHLLPQFTERIDLIYLDPPYNTQQRMRYRDRFRIGVDAFRQRLGRDCRDAHEAQGRHHVAWLSLMLPRLILARQYLHAGGVIAVSIDDRESHHLRMLMDEVFGEANFIATVVWRKKVVRGRGARHILPQTEYVHLYAKDLRRLPPFGEPLTDDMRALYQQRDEQGPYKLVPLAKTGTAHSARPNLVYPIQAPDGTWIPCPTHQWRWSRETLQARLAEVVFRQGRDGAWRVFSKQRLHLADGERQRTPVSYYDRATTTDGTRELKRIFGRPVMDFPKPTRLIKDLITWLSADRPDAALHVLDFFAGTCPTAHAILALNATMGTRHRFLCVQAPEPIDDPEFATIADLARTRITRVAQALADQPHIVFQTAVPTSAT